jgi:hypothetical protein
MPLNLGDLRIKSSAFASLGRIPRRNAGDGDDLSPQLEWAGAPSGTREFALVCHDPDAPLIHGFTHWVLYGIPSTTTRLPEGQKPSAFIAGVNSAGKTGYTGPYPPNGHGPHHYYFWVYALDGALGLKAGLSMEQLLNAIDGHVLEQARTVGLYER